MENSRRDFLKKAGLASAAAISLPGIISASEKKETCKKKIGKSGLKILFQGDSITDGNRTRDNDWNHIMGHGYAYLISSRLWFENPDKNYMFLNRGISGNRIRDLEKRWKENTIDLKPDILSILAGVNDVHAIVGKNDPEPAEKFEERYRNLISKTKEVLPDTKIVICEPFIWPLSWVKDEFDIWKKEMEKCQKIVRKLAEEYNSVFVELQEPFNKACKKAPMEYWIWDGIHPMPAGHELIAREWIRKTEHLF